MNFLRNFICLLFIILITAILLVNSEAVRSKAKEWVQAEFKKSTGFTLQVDRVEFDFPRSVVLHNIVLTDTPQGAFSAKKITLTTPMLKIIFGDRNKLSALIHLEGLESDNPSLSFIPTSLQTLLTWSAVERVIEGEIFQLESTRLPFSYSLENKGPTDHSQNQNLASKGKFTIRLAAPNETVHTFSSTVERAKTIGFILEEITGSGKWDMLHNQGTFFLLANSIHSRNFSLSNFGINIENDPNTGHWHYQFTTDGKAVDPFKAALKGFFGFVDGVPQLMFNDLKLESDEYSIALKEPFHLRLEDDLDFVISQAHFNFNDHDLYLSGRANLDEVDLKMDLFKHPFSYTIPGEEYPMTGVLTGSFFLQGTPVNLHGRAEVKVSTFSYTLPGEISPLTGEFSGVISVQKMYDTLHGAAELNLKSFCYAFPGTHSISFEGLSGTISLLGTPDNLHGGADIKINSCSITPPGMASPITGALSGVISVEGSLEDLHGGADLKLNSIVINHPFINKKTLFQIGLTASLLGDAIAIKGDLQDRDVKLLEWEGHCPIKKKMDL